MVVCGGRGVTCRAVNVGEARALMRDFSDRWKSSIERMHRDAVTNFGNLQVRELNNKN